MIPDWRGDLVVVAGTCPTLTSGDLCRARAAGCRALVIGMAWYLAPWADFTVTVGPDFWIENSAALGSSPEFIFEQHGIKAYIPRAWDCIVDILPTNVVRLELLVPPVVPSGGTPRASLYPTIGMHAIKIAIQAEPRGIILLGYDGRTDRGRRHWYYV